MENHSKAYEGHLEQKVKDISPVFDPDFLSKFLILSSLVMIILFGWFVLKWISDENDLLNSMAHAGEPVCGKDAYWHAIIQINGSYFKRSISILGGLAVMFCGVASSFAVARGRNELLKSASDAKLENILKIEGGGVKASLVTASPGLVALVCGACLVCFVVASKDTFGQYQSGSTFKKDGRTYCLMPVVPSNSGGEKR